MLPKPRLSLWFWISSPIVTVIQWVLLVGPIRWLTGRLFAKRAPGTIEELDYTNAFAAFYLSSYMVVMSRGKAIRLNLSRWQAMRFARRHFEGEHGQVTYCGSRLVDWKPTDRVVEITPPPGARRPKVFLSHAHEWHEDAKWVAQVLGDNGLDVWIDEQLHDADLLTPSIERQVKAADAFVPLLGPEFFTSNWCIQEFDHAVEAGRRFYPIKVVEGELVPPPHLREELARMGDPLVLDLRARNALPRLRTLAARIVAEGAAERPTEAKTEEEREDSGVS